MGNSMRRSARPTQSAWERWATEGKFATIPTRSTPNVVVARKVVGGFRVAIPGALLFAADGWIATGYVFVWQIALTRCRATRPRGSPGLAQTLAPLAGN